METRYKLIGSTASPYAIKLHFGIGQAREITLPNLACLVAAQPKASSTIPRETLQLFARPLDAGVGQAAFALGTAYPQAMRLIVLQPRGTSRTEFVQTNAALSR